MKLELLEIPEPCSVPWESMTGDERVRHCAHCHLDVYNLSAMTRAEAERLLHDREGVCVSLLKRHDGTVVTQDCANERTATPTPCKTSPASAPMVLAAAPSKPGPPAGDPPTPVTPPRPPPPPIRLGGAPMPMPRAVQWETVDPRVGRGTLLADLVRAIGAGLPPEEAEPAIREVERALEMPSSWKTASCSVKNCALWIPGGPDPVPSDHLKPRTELVAKIDPVVRAAFDAERAAILLREVSRVAFAGSRGGCPHCKAWIGLPPMPPPISTAPTTGPT